MTTEERFWSKVEKAEGCWLWIGRSRGGAAREYGVFSQGHRPYYAHRVSYELHHGTIPVGQHVHHLCESTLCVNPEHLVLLTAGEHVRRHKTKELCLRGHPLSEARVYRSKRGTVIRNCLACARERRKERV